jgi:hypothetical protein
MRGKAPDVRKHRGLFYVYLLLTALPSVRWHGAILAVHARVSVFRFHATQLLITGSVVLSASTDSSSTFRSVNRLDDIQLVKQVGLTGHLRSHPFCLSARLGSRLRIFHLGSLLE